MTGTLALIGGDPFGDASTFNHSLVESVGASEVVVLPTAAAYEHPEHLVQAAAGHFGAFDIEVRGLDVLRRADALDEMHARAVRDAACIYLVGGSAMHAKSVLMHSAVWEALTEAWQNGATIIGSDAGAQILCDPMVDSRGGAFTVGLALITGVALIPQRNTWSEDALHRIRELSKPGLAVIGVDEATAAIRAPEGTWSAAGTGVVEVHLGPDPVELRDLHR